MARDRPKVIAACKAMISAFRTPVAVAAWSSDTPRIRAAIVCVLWAAARPRDFTLAMAAVLPKVWKAVASFNTPVAAMVISASVVIRGMAPWTASPSLSLMSPIALAVCCIRPDGVRAIASFMPATDCSTTSARTAARSLSSPYFRMYFWASSNLYPYLDRASVWPFMTFPSMVAIWVALSALAPRLSCWAIMSFMTGMMVLRLSENSR